MNHIIGWMNVVNQKVSQEDEKEYRVVKVANIEVWDEANVRHSEVSGGIDELAESIRQIGLLQPPLVQETKKDHYKLIEGQRRLYAVKILRWQEMPVFVLKQPYNLARAKLASLSENIHRKAVVAGDLAYACSYLKERFGSDKQAAKILGISLPTFRKYLGYEGVPEEIKKLVNERVITVSDALRLSQIPDLSLSSAAKFARRIYKLPKPERDRFFVALIEDPSRPLSVIEERAPQLKFKYTVRVHLPEMYAHALYRASNDTRREPEDLAQKAVMEWLDNSGYVK
jgi:ParB family chromosome partitioning protein